MQNLSLETKEALRKAGKSVGDIIFISGNNGIIPTETFFEIANRDYDDDYGAPEVNTSLIVCGDGWWLERAEYDGSEWWEFKTQPKKPKSVAKNILFAVFDKRQYEKHTGRRYKEEQA